MVATRIWAPLLLAILINFKLQFYCNIYLDEDFNPLKSILRGNGSVGCDVFGISLSGRKCYSTRARRHGRIRWFITKWVKHSYVLMAATDNSLSSIDITVFMDVERNPSPISSEEGYDLRKQTRSNTSKIPCYGRNYLLGLRKNAGKPSSTVLETLKKLRLLRFRGCRGGSRKNVQQVEERTVQNISVVIGRRVESGSVIPWLRVEKRRNPCILVSVPKQVVSCEHTSASSGQLAVPKILFTNICSLGKQKSRVRAVVALEADLRNNDIDTCVVSETSLKNDVPDTVVNIPGYKIYRRDRNWSGRDLRNKGGIAIYTRNNLSVIDVYRSNLYEFICLTVSLPSGNCILLSGLYHPPKTTYQECDLMDYLVNFFDTMLDKHPNISIVCGGDLNRLDLTRLKRITGWTALVDFPTRVDSFLDNCFTNRPDLFGKTYPIKMLIKTDHLGFIVPAGKKLKPIHQKVQFRDCREHRKRALYLALVQYIS